MVHELTRDQARRIVVRAQLLDADRPGDVVEVAEQLAAIKIDPTATIASCEHTTLFSRIGPAYETVQLKKAVEDDRLLFEFDGTYRPTSLLPAMLPAMRAWPQRQGTRNWLDANAAFRDDVLARLRAEGPLRAEQIPDTAAVAYDSADGWYGPNQVPRMLEALARQGLVAVSAREGRRRIWDLAERVFGTDVPEYPADEAERMLAERRLQAAGIAKQRSPWTPVGEAGEPARVEGSKWTWRVDPEALARVDDEVDGRVAFLNPYDTMLFDRPRLRELFEFDYVLEQFKPKSQRVYGYFAHPILMGDRFVGLLDATFDKKEGVLRVDAVHELVEFEPEEMDMVRAEIDDLATWLGVPVTGVGER
ncbi:DNA glycosylase AlkZ-like family protein [Microbacterium luticocti]|uniref:DNA glycosylase AlkZ-like family protein n=1 Tax=Microbacterium luticocti TaxID=451764 RepID=UPI001FDFE0BD|nr:crosslink repair DNA glycosylase YcaQ family protein [Microbacterium luticocti]